MPARSLSELNLRQSGPGTFSSLWWQHHAVAYRFDTLENRFAKHVVGECLVAGLSVWRSTRNYTKGSRLIAAASCTESWKQAAAAPLPRRGRCSSLGLPSAKPSPRQGGRLPRNVFGFWTRPNPPCLAAALHRPRRPACLRGGIWRRSTNIGYFVKVLEAIRSDVTRRKTVRGGQIIRRDETRREPGHRPVKTGLGKPNVTIRFNPTFSRAA